MKKFSVACFFLLSALFLSAQSQDSIHKIDSTVVTSLYDRYGFLLRDDSAYNKRAAWWKPALRVNGVNLFHWVLAVSSDAEWASTGYKDWVRNFKAGPEWDRDGFGVNFSGHPHTGTLYFNVARANGYSFWASVPFAFEGSLFWEFLGENERASKNDLVMTPVGGIVLGEIFYRLSSSVLDDRKRGAERVFREIVAGVISPSRSLNRLTSGKMFRVTKEVYGKAPLDIRLSFGTQYQNSYAISGHPFAAQKGFYAGLKIVYGDLFDPVRKKPFDYFQAYGEEHNMKEGIRHAILQADGVLTGRVSKNGKAYKGIFQHFDFWKNPWYALASTGFSGGYILNQPLGRKSFSNSSFYLGIAPVTGSGNDNDAFQIPDRSYSFSGGLRAKIEEELTIGNRATLSFTNFFYWTKIYKGVEGSEFIQLFRPSLSVRVFRNIHLAYDYELYYKNHYGNSATNYKAKRTASRFGLQFNFKDHKPGKE